MNYKHKAILNQKRTDELSDTGKGLGEGILVPETDEMLSTL